MSETNKWKETYLKLAKTAKIEERFIIDKQIKGEYELHSLFLQFGREEEKEAKLIKKQMGTISNAMDKAVCLVEADCSPVEMNRQLRIIQETIQKGKITMRQRYEELTREEDELEEELQRIEAEIGQMPEPAIEENKPAKQHVKVKSSEIKENEDFEGYVRFVLRNKKTKFNEDFSEDKVDKIVQGIDCLPSLKQYIADLEGLMSLDLKDGNLGWSQDRHNEFLKYKAYFNGKTESSEFYTFMCGNFAHIDSVEVRKYINNYRKYEQLIELKKKLINRYKEIQHLSQKDAEKRVIASAKIETKQRQTNSAEKKKLLEWKIKKREEKERKEREEKERIAAEKKKEREKYQKRKEEANKKLKEFKRTKTAEEPKREQNTVQYNEIDIARIIERNRYLVGKKVAFRRDKEVANEVEPPRKKINNAQSKLHVKTKTTLNKQRDKHDYTFSKDGLSMANNNLYRTTRAVPAWRKGC